MRITNGIFAVVLATLAGLGWFRFESSGGDGQGKSEAEIPGHLKGLIRLSPQRRPLDPGIAVLCAAPKGGPHATSAILVYANELVVSYRRTHAEGNDFPVGAVFLKEKYDDLKVDQADLATVMRRIGEKGTIDDWDFSVISLPDGKSVPMNAKQKAACADCHSGFEKRGFVSRYTYNLMAPGGNTVRE